VRRRILLGPLGLAAVALGLATASAAPALTPDTVFLEELTWTEARDAIQSGRTVAIVPIGGTEQNGPHMALGKHNARVKALSERVARALGNALVAPVIAYVPEGRIDPPTGHMRFPGTLSVPDDVFQRVVEHAARSLRAHGFRDIVLLGDHGSTQAGEKVVAARLNREWSATPVRVHAIEEYYRASEAGFHELLRQRGYGEEELGAHAGLSDTSLMLAVDPRLVRPDRLGPAPGAAAGGRSRTGVDGDPARASADLGRLGVELIVTKTVEAIRQSIARERR
jgi:creatinine amidohydrolase